MRSGVSALRATQGRLPRRPNHASSYIELAVAGVEAVLLIFVAVPLWAKAVDKFPAAKDSTVIQVVAQQYRLEHPLRRP